MPLALSLFRRAFFFLFSLFLSLFLFARARVVLFDARGVSWEETDRGGRFLLSFRNRSIEKVYRCARLGRDVQRPRREDGANHRRVGSS